VQTRLQQFGVSPMKIDSIFISHIHGDHVFGISVCSPRWGCLRVPRP
jgi:ribonuclease BN (tRNA processing enzyme)